MHTRIVNAAHLRTLKDDAAGKGNTKTPKISYLIAREPSYTNGVRNHPPVLIICDFKPGI